MATEGSKKVVPSRGSEQFMLRLPAGMRDAVRLAAENGGRSMNTEIVTRLEDSFAPDGPQAMREALKEAGEVAESLRANLTQRLDKYAALADRLQDREQFLGARAEELSDRKKLLEEYEADLQADYATRRADLEKDYLKRLMDAEGALEERRVRLEEQYRKRLDEVEDRWKAADEYAGFTIAREKEFTAVIKKLTGVEPGPVTPVPRRQPRPVPRPRLPGEKK